LKKKVIGYSLLLYYYIVFNAKEKTSDFFIVNTRDLGIMMSNWQ